MERDPVKCVGQPTQSVDGPKEKKHGYTDQILQNGPNLHKWIVAHGVGPDTPCISVVLRCNAMVNYRAIAVYNRVLAMSD